MRNYKMTISYEGSRYQGWQRQVTTDNTIQGILEKVISKVVGYKVEVSGSGRTDSGVHAYGQVANVKLAEAMDNSIFRDQLNEELPEDIRIRKIELVKENFHSRLNAKAKVYKYCIDTKERPNVFTRKYTYHVVEKLDIEKMQEAAKYLVGKHNFISFCDKKEMVGTTREIYDIIIIETEGIISMEYFGSGFLYHMVRILTGTIIEVGMGSREASDMKRLLYAKSRKETGFLAPARGLVLKKVLYH